MYFTACILNAPLVRFNYARTLDIRSTYLRNRARISHDRGDTRRFFLSRALSLSLSLSLSLLRYRSRDNDLHLSMQISVPASDARESRESKSTVTEKDFQIYVYLAGKSVLFQME